MNNIIEVNNLSKKYKYGESQLYYTFRDTLDGIIKAPLQLFKLKVQNETLVKDEFWALKDVSFSLKQGDVLGVVGPNGSGKSTLLKILSQITSPTTGSVTLRGRVGSLLEVGTGFQQELTGRENIYLNGAILGMKRREIDKKFDEIVDFSGVAKFLDTPVKHYSSGMYMRLAFAVAANLDSEILIVDEVLAVGDAEFQKKCLGKMSEITKKEGRTILFVSHNMSAIKKLCNRCIYIKSGQKILEDSPDTAIEKYLESSAVNNKFASIDIPELKIKINKLSINEKDGGKVYPFKKLEIKIEIVSQSKIDGLGLQVMISNDDTNGRVFSSDTKTTKNIDIVIKKGTNRYTCLINSFNLCSGKYKLGFGIDKPFVKFYYHNPDLYYFEVFETPIKGSLITTNSAYGHVYLDHEWLIGS